MAGGGARGGGRGREGFTNKKGVREALLISIYHAIGEKLTFGREKWRVWRLFLIKFRRSDSNCLLNSLIFALVRKREKAN